MYIVCYVPKKDPEEVCIVCEALHARRRLIPYCTPMEERKPYVRITSYMMEHVLQLLLC